MILSLWFVSICIVTVYSLIPTMEFPVNFWNADKLYHCASYIWLAVLPMTGFAIRRTAMMAALSMIILGVLLEIGQYYIPGRLFSFLDMTSNTFGVILGIILGNYLRKKTFSH
jgi:VanZ family protein